VISADSNTGARISVIGAGYVGLVTSACLADLGHTVTCVEIDPERLAQLKQGQVPIYEPGLDEMVARNRLAGRLLFTADHAAAVQDAAIAFIAVNTPPGPDGQADTSFVFSAARAVIAHAAPGLIVVTKSTVPVGTGDALRHLAVSAGRADIEVVSNPEFLREGCAIGDFMAPDRIVVGSADRSAAEAVARLYEPLGVTVVVADRRSAELAKYAANAFLATRISFMNEIATICEAVAADVTEVARIIGMDRRIGPAFLQAGLGWGGSCFPKDVRALAATAAQHNCRHSILHAVFDVNARQRQRVVNRLRDAVAGQPNPTVAVLGLAFKPGTDDVREAPALEIVADLIEAGIHVRAHDPVAVENARRALPHIAYCPDAYAAASGAHALLVATEWREYRSLDWRAIRDLMRGTLVIDGRNVLDGALLSSLGFAYAGVGRPPAAAAHLNGYYLVDAACGASAFAD
jgi:UDPglucose 6-dehydrogenase